ncbi:unnamed protein product [Didymodactylos carnosus]|uniref:Ribosomal RNA-processing protein 8 n=1 Tax=Didymodactylos carnosus TaxID=1234261 RepID=A0A814KTK3_9BILA|nr:unnamed protein product [Didymodactylos carnosus]CAF1377899.1 unnamed protein product [Didymodactylos carnosus]CAF3824764.1 unnamed protein product [Didymodactylos carnosus]CAF4186557.1 unnamed protein product [Didymodactylos carnosus]
MPHKRRTNKHKWIVDRILNHANSSLLDGKKVVRRKNVKSHERVPRKDNVSEQRYNQLLQGSDNEDDNDDKKEFNEKSLKNHIANEMRSSSMLIPKKSKKNKYFLKNHPEFLTVEKDHIKYKQGQSQPQEKPKKRKLNDDIKDVVQPEKLKKQQQPQEKPKKRKLDDDIKDVVQPKKLKKQQQQSNVSIDEKPAKLSACDKLLAHMSSSRFRYLNEQLYRSTSSQAEELFKSDPQAFYAYHRGFDDSMKKWPNNPLNDIIKYVNKRSSKLVIADMGCGTAQLAQSVKNKVYSFDLIALNEHVHECDICHTPLENETIDIVIFCLSLMGTNMNEYIFEAFRILKLRGMMKIIEIASRFDNVNKFIRKIESIGFQCSKTNTTINDIGNDGQVEGGMKKKKSKQKLPTIYFYTFDFIKISNKIQSHPIITLTPCLHKKR